MLGKPRHDALPGVGQKQSRWISHVAYSTFLNIVRQWLRRFEIVTAGTGYGLNE
jgi:hypothetical protein